MAETRWPEPANEAPSSGSAALPLGLGRGDPPDRAGRDRRRLSEPTAIPPWPRQRASARCLRSIGVRPYWIWASAGMAEPLPGVHYGRRVVLTDVPAEPAEPPRIATARAGPKGCPGGLRPCAVPLGKLPFARSSFDAVVQADALF